jgi:hypothetical protein
MGAILRVVNTVYLDNKKSRLDYILLSMNSVQPLISLPTTQNEERLRERGKGDRNYNFVFYWLEGRVVNDSNIIVVFFAYCHPVVGIVRSSV